MVKFVNYRDLRNTPSAVWAALERNEALAILANGQPRALMLAIENGDIESVLELVRRVRAQLALARLRAGAERRGVSTLTDKDIDREVGAARRAGRRRTKRRKS
jgi:alpha-D-ribose 1-methylphosphonate 5-triphosphate synthase subunit PhnG